MTWRPILDQVDRRLQEQATEEAQPSVIARVRAARGRLDDLSEVTSEVLMAAIADLVTALDGMTRATATRTCTRCGHVGRVAVDFGWRRCKIDDGHVQVLEQPQCHTCRSLPARQPPLPFPGEGS